MNCCMSERQEYEKQRATLIFELTLRYRSNYEGVRVYLHGDEVANSWANLTAFLEEHYVLSKSVQRMSRIAWISANRTTLSFHQP